MLNTFYLVFKNATTSNYFKLIKHHKTRLLPSLFDNLKKKKAARGFHCYSPYDMI